MQTKDLDLVVFDCANSVPADTGPTSGDPSSLSDPFCLAPLLIDEMASHDHSAQMTASPWAPRLAVDRARSEVVALAMWSAAPSATGSVTMKIYVTPERRRRGFGTQVVVAMATWAAAHRSVGTVCVQVSGDPSENSVLSTLGFRLREASTMTGATEVMCRQASDFLPLM